MIVTAVVFLYKQKIVNHLQEIMLIFENNISFFFFPWKCLLTQQAPFTLFTLLPSYVKQLFPFCLSVQSKYFKLMVVVDSSAKVKNGLTK